MTFSLKLCIEYCWYHRVWHVCNIPNKFLERFPPRNCVAVFQWNWNQKYSFSQQLWEVSKIPSCFVRLVYAMECLMTCIVRFSGIVRQLINPSWKNDRKNTIILNTGKDIICRYPFQVKARRQFHTAIWNVTHDSLNLTHSHLWTHIWNRKNTQSILLFPWH